MKYVQEFLIEIREYLIRRYPVDLQTMLLTHCIELLINSNEEKFDFDIPLFICSKNNYKFLRTENFWKNQLLILDIERANFIIDYIIEKPKTHLLESLFESILKLNNMNLFILPLH